MFNSRDLGIRGWVLLLCSMLFSPGLFAQSSDSLFVMYDDNQLTITHRAAPGETIFMLARRYHVPAAVLADVNKLSYTDVLVTGKKVLIPVAAYNHLLAKPKEQNTYRPIFYRVTDRDNLFTVSKKAGISQFSLQAWNRLQQNEVRPGQLLNLGWVSYSPEEVPSSKTESTVSFPTRHKSGIRTEGRYDTVIVLTVPVKKEPAEPDSDSAIATPWVATTPLEKLYMQQTNDEFSAYEEKGTAVFFDMQGKVSKTSTFFAFHNEAPRGTVIKVYNPGTKQQVFVKVLGPIPGTKQYHNSLIAISSGAKNALGVTEDRTWCELKYAIGY